MTGWGALRRIFNKKASAFRAAGLLTLGLALFLAAFGARDARAQDVQVMSAGQAFRRIENPPVFTADQHQTARKISLRQVSEELDAIHFRHIEIANDDIGAGGLQGREGLLAIGSGHNIFHADGIQGGRHHRPRELFVVDDQYAEGTEVFGHGARSKPRKAINSGWGFPSESFLVRYPWLGHCRWSPDGTVDSCSLYNRVNAILNFGRQRASRPPILLIDGGLPSAPSQFEI